MSAFTPYYADPMVRLYHGDCREILPSLPRPFAHAVITDPPFFMPAQQYAGRDVAWQRSWADVSILATWWDVIAGMLQPMIMSDGHFLTFCDDASYPAFYPAIYTRWPNIGCLVWDKGRIGMGTAWRQSMELIIAARSRSAYWGGSAAMGNVLRFSPVPSALRVHPVDKPEALLRALIEPTTPFGGLVLDPFAGGGSTLLAARMLGRRAIGVELDEKYAEVAAKRLAQQPLGMAERDSNPQSPIPGRSTGPRLLAHTAPDSNPASGHPSSKSNAAPHQKPSGAVA